MSNENKQPDERAAEADMRAAFLQQMGEPWETALDAKRRIWSLAWGASRFYAHQAQLDERAAFEAWAIKEGLDVLPSPHWANTTFHSLPTEDSWRGWQARATKQATTGDERAAAFEEAARVCEQMAARPEFGQEIQDRMLHAAAKKIRALTPSPVAGSAGQAPVTLSQVAELETAICNNQNSEALRLLHHIRNAIAAPSLAIGAGAVLSHPNEVAIAKQYDIDESLVRDLWREFAAMHSEQRMSDAARVEWQPIETAPKDREIWAFNGEQGRMIWSEGHDWALWIWADPLLSDADPCPEQPTHWREFPTAPIDAARAAEIERSEGKS